MGYCAASDIQEDFPATIFDDTDTSKVKLASLTNFIADADALINSYLSGRYVVPVVDTEALKVLKFYSRSLVADKVTGILQIKQQTNSAGNQNVRTGLSTKDVIKLLQDLQSGDAQLPGDPELALEDGGLASFNSKNRIEPEFKKSERNW